MSVLENSRITAYMVMALIIAGVGVLVAAFIIGQRVEDRALPDAIEEVSPVPGSEVLAQTSVSVDLRSGFTGNLEANGAAIPESQLNRQNGLNKVTFRPGSGQIFEGWLPEQNCITVIYWQIVAGPEQSSRYTWCFTSF